MSIDLDQYSHWDKTGLPSRQSLLRILNAEMRQGREQTCQKQWQEGMGFSLTFPNANSLQESLPRRIRGKPFILVNHAYRFIYMRNVGKMGGTAIKRQFLEPFLCYTLFDPEGKIEEKERIFQGPSVPVGCDRVIFSEPFGFRVDDGDHFLVESDYFAFTFVRNPCVRVFSSYEWVIKPKRRSNFTFDDFLRRPADIWQYATEKKGHWV